MNFTWRSPGIPWHSPDIHLTIIWPSPDPYLTLISSFQLKKSYLVVVGGDGWWANPLQTLLRFTFDPELDNIDNEFFVDKKLIFIGTLLMW